MTRSLAINENNDIFAVNGRLQIAVDVDAVLQTCERVIQAVLGEMIYNTGLGVDYFGTAFSGSPNVLQFEASARRQLRRVPDVISVDEFTAEIRNNALVYSATIRTIHGSGSING